MLSGDQVVRRRLRLSNGLILIEGLGCINSNGMLLDYLNPEAEYASSYTFLARCEGGDTGQTVIYDYEKDSDVKIVELSTVGIVSYKRGCRPKTDAVFDLQGRLGSPALHDGAVLCIDMHMVTFLMKHMGTRM